MELTRYIYITLCLFACCGVAAQDPVCRNITNLNGLPSNTVYYLLQDNRGFIWLAHDRGLSRYDGREFKQYSTGSQVGRSLSNLVQVGSDIWCQDFSGNFYYTRGDSLVPEPAIKTQGTFIATSVVGGNTLVSCKQDSLRQFNITQRKYLAVHNPHNFLPAQCAADGGLYFLSTGSVLFYQNGHIRPVQTLPGRLPRFFYLVKNESGFAALTRDTYPYVYFIGRNGITAQPLLQPGIFIQDVCVVEEEIWISTSAGAWCFTKNWQPKYGGRCFYAGSSITRIMKDREGSYWFGTLNNGVMVVPNINALLFRHKNDAITALAISHREQAVFAGTSANAVLRFNPVVNTFSKLYQAPGTQEVLHVYADEEAGRMLVSSEKTRVYRQQVLQKDLVLGIKNVCRLNSAFYAAAFSGGYGLLPAANNGNVRPPDWLPVHPIDDQKFYRLNEQDIRGRWVCFTEKDSTLYAAAADGLHYYSPRGRGMVRFAGKDIYPSHLVADGVQVFAATFSEGLFRVAGNKAIPVTGTNRPVMRSIHRICYDGRFIWAAGDAVLQKINHNTGEVIEYTYADGLPRAELKDVQVQNGMVYLATTLGMVVFSGNAASENKTPPLLVLNRVMVNDRVVNLDETNKFSWAQNNISIHFSALAFKAEEWVQVQYRINNGQWNNLNDGARVINLSALSPGNYTISIRAFNEDRVVSVQPVQLTFSIAPPFYKTLWFVSLVLASATALVYIYFRSKLNNEKRNAELLKQKMILEQELHQSMMASIKSQMNPHFLFNALNTIQAYIYTNEKEHASLYLGKFSELTRMVLDMSNKERVSLAQEIKALQLYLELEQLRFEDKLHYTFTVDEQIGTETVFIPAMLIQPYVENAIKHGLMHLRGVWQLDISFVLAGSVIEVTIEDNGVGRKASAAINAQRSRRHRSFAAGANQKRLDILNKGNQAAIALEITDKEDAHGPAGTRVTLRIPVAGR